jgi:NADH-quinone oxidoreductase subunit J
MIPLLASLPDWRTLVACPTAWGLLLGVVGLYLLLPPVVRRKQFLGGALACLGFAFLAVDMARLHLDLRVSTGPLAAWGPQGVFWLLAGVAVIGGAGTISAKNPVYSAIWFALSLIGVAAVFLLQGAHFLGVATVIVYAGAIVVTFLFVIMLAQPEGHAVADRISWGTLPKVGGVLIAGTLVGLLADVLHSQTQGGLRDQLAVQFSGPDEFGPRLARVELSADHSSPRTVTLALRGSEQLDQLGVPDADVRAALAPFAPSGKPEDIELVVQRAVTDIPAEPHLAQLGGYLFSRHLIAVELAGTLLLAALVAAVGMMLQGRYAKEGAAHE